MATIVASTVATRLLPVATSTLLRAAVNAVGVARALPYHCKVNPWSGKARTWLALSEKSTRIAIGR